MTDHARAGHASTRSAGIAGLVLVCGIGACGLHSTLGSASDSCTGGPVVRVAAPPEVSQLVQDLADALPQARGCVSYQVSPLTGAAALDRLRHPAERPALWIAESTAAVDRARAALPELPELPTTLPKPFATSPLVAGMSTHLAASIAPRGEVSWQRLARADVRLRLSDPRTTGPGEAAVLALHQALAPQAPGEAAPEGGRSAELTAALTRAAPAVTTTNSALDGVIPTGQDVYLVTEQQLSARVGGAGAGMLSGTEGVGDGALVAVQLTPGTLALAYRALPISTSDPAVRAAATQLADALVGGSGAQAVTAAGLRAPEARSGPALPTLAGTAPLPATMLAEPTVAQATDSRRQWGVLTSTLRMLVVVDGSMRADGRPVEESYRSFAQALGPAVASLPDSARIGLRVSGVPGEGQTSWRELLPMSELGGAGSPTRARVTSLARELPQQGGSGALADAVADAVAALRADYSTEKVAAVLVLTDGSAPSEDAQRARSRLLTSVRINADGGTNIRVVPIVLGSPEAAASWREISAASGSDTHAVPNAAGLKEAVQQAVTTLVSGG